MAPDGVSKNMYVFNNSFPGPTIEANWGDTLVIHVKNNLETNGYVSFRSGGLIFSTSIHWHGFLQHGSAASDGVPGVTQCKAPLTSSLTQVRFPLANLLHTSFVQPLMELLGTTVISPYSTPTA